MINATKHGWRPETMGDIDHKKMKPPFIRLVDIKKGRNGDDVSLFDLRVVQPNQTSLPTILLHSMEHVLIEGFRHFVPEHFINAAPMGCQTGFYIILLNFHDMEKVGEALEKILVRSLTIKDVPYKNVDQCGQAIFHDMEKVKNLSRELLDKKKTWFEII